MKRHVSSKAFHKSIAEFEKQFGSTAFVKAILSAFNRILIDKGIVNKDELLGYYTDELKSVRKKLTAMAMERHKFFIRHQHVRPSTKQTGTTIVRPSKRPRVLA